MTSQEKLNSILDKASLPEDVKLLWQEVFRYLKTSELITLLGILERSTPQDIQDISFNLKKKVIALKSKDINLWREIIEEEKASLS